MSKRRIVRRTADTRGCSCGETSLEITAEEVIVRGKGWRKAYQFIVCGSCNEPMRYAPNVVWETTSGARYDTRQYLKGADG